MEIANLSMPGQSTSTGRKNVLTEDFMKEVEDESVRKPQWKRRSRTCLLISCKDEVLFTLKQEKWLQGQAWRVKVDQKSWINNFSWTDAGKYSLWVKSSWFMW